MHEVYGMEQSEHNDLEEEEVCVAREPIDPCYPHEKRVKHAVDKPEVDYDLAFHMLQQTVVECHCENCQVQVEKRRVLVQKNFHLITMISVCGLRSREGSDCLSE